MRSLGITILALCFLGVSHGGYCEPLLLITNRDDASMSVYQVRGPRSVKLVKTITTPKTPREMCLAPDGHTAYIGTAGGGQDTTVTVLDLDKLEISATLRGPELQFPDGCAVSPDSKELYVVEAKTNRLLVYSTMTGKLLSTIAVGAQPRRALLSPDGRTLLVSNAESDELSVIDTTTRKVVNVVKTGREPRAMTYSADGKYLMVTVIEDDSVNYFKANTLELDQSVGTGQSPQRIIASKDGRFVFVLGRIGNVVSVADLRPGAELRRQANTILVGALPWGMATDPKNEFLYVTSTAENEIDVIDVALMKMIGKLPTGRYPYDIVYRP